MTIERFNKVHELVKEFFPNATDMIIGEWTNDNDNMTMTLYFDDADGEPVGCLDVKFIKG